VAVFRPLREGLVISGAPADSLNIVAALLVLAPVPVSAWVHRRYRVATGLSDALRDLSRFDTLTGVFNRQALTTWTGLHTRPPHALGSPCVLFVDIDRFKHVNDTHGHQVGDALLVEVAARITRSVRAGDVVVRLGGDEFLVLCDDVVSVAAAERVAMRLKAAIEEPIVVRTERIKISVSIGIAMADRADADLEALIHQADRAMYRSKSGATGAIAVADRAEDASPIVTELELMRAIERGELLLHYQPLVRLDDEQLIGVEALLRWQHPIHGLLPPMAFVPLLEESGLIVAAGEWVLEEAARQARHWERRFGPERSIHVSVNVSPRQLNQADFTSVARDAIARGGANPRHLWLEITEGALLRDPAAAWSALRQLKSLGVSLALDDFGTGFSSLSYIRRFDLDVLKIDRSFVTGVHESVEDRAIVQHVIGLAHALGMSAVAEGVEEAAQADVLRSLGCDAVQGYWYGRPVTADEIDAMVEASMPAGPPRETPAAARLGV
jgi:diguanylate cyclase (GGDEF)-like protein